MRHNLLQMNLEKVIYACVSAKQIQSLQAMAHVAGQKEVLQLCIAVKGCFAVCDTSAITIARYKSLC